MMLLLRTIITLFSLANIALALLPIKPSVPTVSSAMSLRMSISGSPYPRSSSLETAFKKNPTGVRIFHPAHPLKLLEPLEEEQLSALLRVKQLMGVSDSSEESKEASEPFSKSKHLPWYTFPKIGVPDSSNFLSRLEIDELYEKHRHEGQLVWAYYLDQPRKGCLLLNHWQQKVMYLAEYDVERGAKGYELNHIVKHQSEGSNVVWPPFALEFELTDHLWEPVMVSNNLLTSEILDLLPPKLGPKAYWELIFLLLVQPDKEEKVMQALFDTGISPNKGLIAYLRLLNKVVERTSTYDNVPEYRQIVEEEIIL